MAKRIEFDGKVHEFPDDFTDSEVQNALSNQPPPIPERSLSGFGQNLASSGGKFLSDLGSAIAHPIDTATGVAKLGAGALEQAVRTPIEAVTGKYGQLTPEEQVFRGAVGAYKERYRSPSAAMNTAYTDPVGALADVSTLFGGAGSAAKLARAPRITEAMRLASTVTNPMNAVTKPVQAVARRAFVGANKPVTAQGVATGFYESALKIPPGTPRTERLKRVATGLQERIPVSEEGLAMVEQRIDDLNKQIADRIQQGADVPIDPQKVASRLSATRETFGTQVNPQPDLAAVGNVEKNFLDRHSYEAPYTKIEPTPGAETPYAITGYGKTRTYKDIPLGEAQAEKQGTYQQLRKKYGEMKSAEVEAEKTLARGLKEEIVSVFPELAGLNARDSRLIALEQSLERFANRHANRDQIGAGAAWKTMAGAAMGGSAPIVGGMIGLALSALEHPEIKSKLAIALANPSQGQRMAGTAASVATAPLRPSIATPLSRIPGATQPQTEDSLYSPSPATLEALRRAQGKR